VKEIAEMRANRFDWFKSSYSAENGACVEVRGNGSSGMDFRDSKEPHVVLAFTADACLPFIAAVKRGRLSRGSSV
jgi:hypothetical protein